MDDHTYERLIQESHQIPSCKSLEDAVEMGMGIVDRLNALFKETIEWGFEWFVRDFLERKFPDEKYQQQIKEAREELISKNDSQKINWFYDRRLRDLPYIFHPSFHEGIANEYFDSEFEDFSYDFSHLGCAIESDRLYIDPEKARKALRAKYQYHFI